MSHFRTIGIKNELLRRAKLLLAASLLVPWHAVAQTGTTLDDINFSQLPGNRVQIELSLSAPINEPLNFAIDSPARIALDFPGVKLNLARRTETIVSAWRAVLQPLRPRAAREWC